MPLFLTIQAYHCSPRTIDCEVLPLSETKTLVNGQGQDGTISMAFDDKNSPPSLLLRTLSFISTFPSQLTPTHRYTHIPKGTSAQNNKMRTAIIIKALLATLISSVTALPNERFPTLLPHPTGFIGVETPKPHLPDVIGPDLTRKPHFSSSEPTTFSTMVKPITIPYTPLNSTSNSTVLPTSGLGTVSPIVVTKTVTIPLSGTGPYAPLRPTFVSEDPVISQVLGGRAVITKTVTVAMTPVAMDSARIMKADPRPTSFPMISAPFMKPGTRKPVPTRMPIPVPFWSSRDLSVETASYDKRCGTDDGSMTIMAGGQVKPTAIAH